MYQSKQLLEHAIKLTDLEKDGSDKFTDLLTITYFYELLSDSIDPQFSKTKWLLKSSLALFDKLDCGEKKSSHYYYIFCLQAKLGLKKEAQESFTKIGEDYLVRKSSKLKLLADFHMCRKEFPQAMEKYQHYFLQIEKEKYESKGFDVAAVIGSLHRMDQFQTPKGKVKLGSFHNKKIEELVRRYLKLLEAWTPVWSPVFFKHELLCYVYSYLGETDKLRSSMISYLTILAKNKHFSVEDRAEGIIRMAVCQCNTKLSVDADLKAFINKILKWCPIGQAAKVSD